MLMLRFVGSLVLAMLGAPAALAVLWAGVLFLRGAQMTPEGFSLTFYMVGVAMVCPLFLVPGSKERSHFYAPYWFGSAEAEGRANRQNRLNYAWHGGSAALGCLLLAVALDMGWIGL